MNGLIRPFQGQVLIEVLRPPSEDRGLHLLENRKLNDRIGREPAREGIVRSCGIWATTKHGHLIPYEFRKGDRVLVDPVLGRHVLAYPHNLRLYNHRDILAKVNAPKMVWDQSGPGQVQPVFER